MKKIDDIEFYKDIGKRIAHFRNIQDWSQVEFAKKLGVQQQVLANYEIARNRIPVSLLVKVANKLQVDVEDLLESRREDRKKSTFLPKLKRCMEALEKLPEEKQKLACDILTCIIKNQK